MSILSQPEERYLTQKYMGYIVCIWTLGEIGATHVHTNTHSRGVAAIQNHTTTYYR